MQGKDKVFGSWALYLSIGIYYEVYIMHLCSLVLVNRNVNVTKPEQFSTIYEKCKFLSMGYINNTCIENAKYRPYISLG